MRGLAGKKALVTGAGRGIGRAVAMRMAAEGVSVAVNYKTSGDAANAVVAEGQALGHELIAIQADVSDATSVDHLLQAATSQLGGLDILVNNAGIVKDNLILRMTDEDWDTVLTTNLKSAFLCTRAAIRIMLRQKSGRIINMSSVVGITGNAGQANYSAAKAGLIGLTKTVAREVASRHITVNAVAPGFIETQMVNQMNDAMKTSVLERIPLARFGTVDDVAASVTFLASEDAAYITGQILGIDGGLAL